MFSRYFFCGVAFICFAAAPVYALETAPNKLISYEVPFLIKMNWGSPDVIVAKNGDLQLIARCVEGTPPSLLGRSYYPFWSSNNLYLDQGGELVIDSGYTSSGPSFLNPIDDGSVLQYGTHYIAVDSETSGYGVSIFDADCLFIGKAIILRSCKVTDLRCILDK